MSYFPYDDIVNLPHHVSTVRKPMSMENRAAQFAPFAALTGHDEAIAETARITDGRIEQADERLAALSRRLAYVLSLTHRPEIDITYFKPDSRKAGGAYVTIRGVIKKVEQVDAVPGSGDAARRVIILADNTRIFLDCITDLDGHIFDGFDD